MYKLDFNNNYILGFLDFISNGVDHLGLKSEKYIIYNFYDFSDTKKYLRKIRTPVNKTELEEAIKDPAIIHHDLCQPKVWTLQTVFTAYNTLCKERKNCSCKKYQDLWFSYANKTDYFSEILNYTKRKEYKFS